MRPALGHPLDLWWSWGHEATTYYLRIVTVTIPVWRTKGAPYSIRRVYRDAVEVPTVVRDGPGSSEDGGNS